MAETIDRIAFIDDQGDLYTADPAGQDRQPALPEDAGWFERPAGRAVSAVNWPTWSPTGNQIAVSWVGRVGRRLAVRLIAIDRATGTVHRIYDNPTDVPPGIAPNVPHYIAWSPDGQRLAFLTMTAAGQTLFLARVDGSEPIQSVATGAPFFPIWSPDSRRVLFHLAEDLHLVEVGRPPRSLAAPSRAYRVPAWSPDGHQIAFVEDRGSAAHLIVADAAGENRRSLGPAGIGTALLWSPGGAELAVSQPAEPGDAYQGIEIVPIDGSARRRIVREDLIGFFWSPDGTQLAYVGVNLNDSELYWSRIDATGDNPRRLIGFVPSRDTMTALTFFDQYAASVRFWSPDSRSLVFTGRLSQPLRTNGHGGSAAHFDQIQVIDTTGAAPPRSLSRGTLGFWSWH